MDTALLVEVCCDGEPVRSSEPSQHSAHRLSATRRIDLSDRGRSRLGWYWSSTTGAHVAFHNTAERDLVLSLDSDPGVIDIVSQPAAFPLELDRPTPSYFVALRSGDYELIYHHLAKLSEAERDQLESSTGWKVRQSAALTRDVLTALRWLSGFRHPRNHTDIVAQAIRQSLSEPKGLRQVLALSGDVAPTLYHLIWIGVIRADLSQGLHDDTRLTLA